MIKLYQQCFFAYRQYARCKYFPNCSDYMIMALQKYGFFAGVTRGVWRIMRCHPLAKGGLDLP